MRIWTRLQQWVAEEADSAQIYRRMAQTAALHARKEAALWRDPDLGIGLSWQKRAQPHAVWAARYSPDFDLAMGFLKASKSARDFIRRTWVAMFLLVLTLGLAGATVLVAQQQQKQQQKTLDSVFDLVSNPKIKSAISQVAQLDATSPSAGPSATLVSEADIAARELTLLGAGDPSRPIAKGVKVYYYPKLLDNEKIVPALLRLGLSVTYQHSLVNQQLPTNTPLVRQ